MPHSSDDVEQLLHDLFVKPRVLMRRWAAVTQQTSQARLAYPGQHLASVVTGVPGTGTAARGEDLLDGSEVKSCSKADQLGKCKDCAARVPAWMTECPECGGTRLDRKKDSHWIVSIRREQELEQLVNACRIVLVMFDRSAASAEDIRVRIWEVWPREPRHAYFAEFVTDYYRNNYLVKRAHDLDTSPCNFHPLKFDHLMMNPVKVLDATIESPDDPAASVRVDLLVPAADDRGALEPEPMPVSVCRRRELVALADVVEPEEFAPCLRADCTTEDVARALRSRRPVAELDRVVSGIPASVRRHFAMRTKRIKMTPSDYRRRTAASA